MLIRSQRWADVDVNTQFRDHQAAACGPRVKARFILLLPCGNPARTFETVFWAESGLQAAALDAALGTQLLRQEVQLDASQQGAASRRASWTWMALCSRSWFPFTARMQYRAFALGLQRAFPA